MDAKYLEEIKARTKIGHETDSYAYKDISALLAEVERLTAEVEHLDREYHHYRRLSEKADQQIATLKKALGSYKSTGFTPEQISAGTTVTFDIGDEGFLKAINEAFKERFGITADDVPKIITERDTLKKTLEDRLKELRAVCGADSAETYTTGYRNGHRNGQIELIEWILEKPSGAVQQAEQLTQEDKK